MAVLTVSQAKLPINSIDELSDSINEYNVYTVGGTAFQTLLEVTRLGTIMQTLHSLNTNIVKFYVNIKIAKKRTANNHSSLIEFVYRILSLKHSKEYWIEL